LKYISRLEFLFKGSGRKSKRITINERQFLDSLPYVLKHTIFLEDDMMKKMRTLSDFAQLFFIADDTKIKGNKAYD
jgi:hypothetical protein